LSITEVHYRRRHSCHDTSMISSSLKLQSRQGFLHCRFTASYSGDVTLQSELSHLLDNLDVSVTR